MSLRIKNIIDYIETIAPTSYAMEWDRVGLQIGSPKKEVHRIMITLEINSDVLKEATDKGADLIVSHHPLIFKPIEKIDFEDPKGAMIQKIIQEDLHVYACHTNMDVAPKGLNQYIAEKIGLNNIGILTPAEIKPYCKFIVYVPETHREKIITAIHKGGGGQIGNYSHCTFGTEGIGTFKPEEGATPFLGKRNELEKVNENKIETIIERKDVPKLLKAVKQAHPYEEVAYDLYPLALEGKTIGLGLFFELKDQVSLETIIKKCHEELKPDALRFFDAGKDKFSRIAICGGSGGSLIEKVVQQQAEIFISGDFRYHDLKLAQDYGLALVDAGHDATEWPGVVFIKKYLEKRLEKENYDTGVYIKTSASKGWQ